MNCEFSTGEIGGCPAQYMNLGIKNNSIFKFTKAHLIKLNVTLITFTIAGSCPHYRNRYEKRGLSTNRRGSILGELITIKTDQWIKTRPGFVDVATKHLLTKEKKKEQKKEGSAMLPSEIIV